jgi:hypothetical protein
MTVGVIRNQDANFATGVTTVGTAAPGNVFYASASGSSAANQTGIFGSSFNNGIGVKGYGGQSFGTGVYGYTYSNATTSIGVLGATHSYFGLVTYLGAGTGVVASSAGGDGLHAQTLMTNRRAIYAYSSHTGSVGVAAYSKFGVAMRAGSPNQVGLFAYSGSQSAIEFISSSANSAGVGGVNFGGGPDLKLGGSGRIVQVATISSGVGAPNYTPTGSSYFSGHSYFESVRADDGALWISGATGTGQAKWKRVNAVRVDAADGTGNPYTPYRAFDTRSGAKKAAGSTTVIQIAGTGSGASSIPSDAVAIIGNLTATKYTGSGYLSLSPAGVSVSTSAVNFITGQTAIANSFIVGLGTGGNAGKVQVKVAGHATHFIIDVTGYMQ